MVSVPERWARLGRRDLSTVVSNRKVGTALNLKQKLRLGDDEQDGTVFLFLAASARVLHGREEYYRESCIWPSDGTLSVDLRWQYTQLLLSIHRHTIMQYCVLCYILVPISS